MGQGLRAYFALDYGLEKIFALGVEVEYLLVDCAFHNVIVEEN